MANFFVSQAYFYIIFSIIFILSIASFALAHFVSSSAFSATEIAANTTARNYFIAYGILGIFVIIPFLIIFFRYPPLYPTSSFVLGAILLALLIVVVQTILIWLAYGNLNANNDKLNQVRGITIFFGIFDIILLILLCISILVLFAVGIRREKEI